MESITYPELGNGLHNIIMACVIAKLSGKPLEPEAIEAMAWRMDRYIKARQEGKQVKWHEVE